MVQELTTGSPHVSLSMSVEHFARQFGPNSAKMPGDFPPRLLAWLRARLGDDGIDYASAPVRLSGGSDTLTFRFSVCSAPSGLGPDLILRVFPEWHGPFQVAKEERVQNLLSQEGYPVARVHLTCADSSVLGRSFLIMQRLPGKPMISVAATNMADTLGAAHATLHNRDPEGVILALDEEGRMPSRGGLDPLAARMRARASEFPQLEPIVAWLQRNRPPEPVRPTVCHGDFHPLNILVRRGAVSGVLDWTSFAVGDRAADIACTTMILSVVGRHVFAVQDPERIVARYLSSYRAHGYIDDDHLHYHQVKFSTRALMSGMDGCSLWRHPPVVRALVAWIHAQTGINLGD